MLSLKCYSSSNVKIVMSLHLFRFLALIVCTLFLQIVIASIMCGYSKEDWTELAQMAEVNCFCIKDTSNKTGKTKNLQLCVLYGRINSFTEC